MIRINLLPIRAAKKKESVRQQASIAGLSIVLLVIILGIFYFSITKTINELRESISNEEKESSRLDKVIGELKNVEAEKKVVLEKLNIVKQLEVNRRTHLKILSDIAGAVPEKVWIETLKDSGQTVVITGFAAADDIVADFMKALEKTLVSWKIELEVVQQAEKEKIKLAGFTIRLEKPKETPPQPLTKPKV
ncbi:MAG: hypothetical protein A3G39_06450 [Deltaproteobacteria bacterium RIFCSPLOWO2_12_FULL_43_16]|nr:MAG: hypothetical protein A2Z89_10035 [Deltaproteobacteria bacterium GWA2_43_19]OGQ12961.1 MAG: hypothetical protein A3D30_03560 [Deltaproteobacteria bacterium RIFCSPHIGHO2_02_FULL_43_33]OGQ38434.1 MAG: hypothetical protein A3A85_05425 [Deltaproteobacteria bacterium RIFCSPLOWO2_01_FULL_42_9]OGQ58420.1 MAG: hypothetical protein A3G39_06450 [Deltaproteobacteria bacterium RIFCSPLOWO2_12_FULL_43_16]HBR16394.1 hypothetical protein [Deltaproteobacteria bacterium]